MLRFVQLEIILIVLTLKETNHDQRLVNKIPKNNSALMFYLNYKNVPYKKKF